MSRRDNYTSHYQRERSRDLKEVTADWSDDAIRRFLAYLFVSHRFTLETLDEWRADQETRGTFTTPTRQHTTTGQFQKE